jgi:hypothetical protein
MELRGRPHVPTDSQAGSCLDVRSRIRVSWQGSGTSAQPHEYRSECDRGSGCAGNRGRIELRGEPGIEHSHFQRHGCDNHVLEQFTDLYDGAHGSDIGPIGSDSGRSCEQQPHIHRRYHSKSHEFKSESDRRNRRDGDLERIELRRQSGIEHGHLQRDRSDCNRLEQHTDYCDGTHRSYHGSCGSKSSGSREQLPYLYRDRNAKHHGSVDYDGSGRSSRHNHRYKFRIDAGIEHSEF